MYAKLFLSFCLLSLTLGCDWPLFSAIQRLERVHGPTPPGINEAYAPRIVQAGDGWRIYLKAADPDGDMKAVVATFEQGGRGASAPAATLLGPQNQKALNGFFVVNTAGWTNMVDAGVRVKIEDMAGHFSNEVSFPLSILPQYSVPPPSLNVFAENNLGPLAVSREGPPPAKRAGWFARLGAWVKRVF